MCMINSRRSIKYGYLSWCSIDFSLSEKTDCATFFAPGCETDALTQLSDVIKSDDPKLCVCV